MPAQAELPLASSPEPKEQKPAPVKKSNKLNSSKRVNKHAKGNQGNGGIVELTKELWQAAVTLRGSIEPSDYKRYVLPIIFLRFLSLRYEKRRAELEKLIADPKSDYFEDKGALEDPDEYRSANTFIVPEQVRWQRIVNEVARRDDVKVQMDKTLKLLEDTYPEKLRGLLPPIYAGSNLDPENLRGIINLFSKEIFESDQNGEDVIGRVYEYFIGEFASSEGKRGGEYFTPSSIVKTLVAMLEPERGKVLDPCCGSGGMFVQSNQFTKQSGRLSFYGQESKDFTYRLCRMNLFIHGLDGDIRLGNSYFNDQHDQLKADYILANPPFNDGSKGENGWGADKVSSKDPRLDLGLADNEGHKRPMPLAKRNANTMWILHFLSHLAPGGTAGFVMATGELSNSETARLEVRKALVDLDFVDCVVQLTGQLFAQTGIPCALWFLSRNRDGSKGYRKRQGEVLFIDARNLGSLIPDSRKQKFLSDKEIDHIAGVYRTFKKTGRPEDVAGFCGVATIEAVEQNRYALTPGRYVGSVEKDGDEQDFKERFGSLRKQLLDQFAAAAELQRTIKAMLEGIS
ncbi:MAG: SAM-dependent DNA methyltransferase [Proteobacteria bacterium]|nr:SAM-dependent DNA methyltransferase [Pseudomonadota bacterium]